MLMSICSKRLSYLIKLGRHRIDDAHVNLKTGDLQIEVNRAPKDFCKFCFNSTENGGLLDLRSDLSKSYSELIKKERELRTRLEEGEDGLRQEIDRIKAEKKDVEVKFYETVDKLEILNVINFGDSLERDV
ncbi:hypothetical protein CAEBREN_12174 [Caenorhabditis brenneri]|uniref:Uncharacterized protein n=1 Tax=Caenorhabditis brenneri TaxID=135651 RepID=G0NZ19_CAEBE|nr:hypothetical protein CAEBREN_12174 [Caenorhabditis brenneri]